MKRFSIEITEKEKPNHYLKDKVIIRLDSFLKFIELAKKLDLWDDLLATADMKCDKCGSFLVDLFTLDDVIEDVIEFIDSKDLEPEFESWENVYNAFTIVSPKLSEAWESIYDYGGNELTEVAIIFDSECSCNAVFVGKDEEETTKDDLIDFHDPNGKVFKWIGPKKI